MQNDAPYDLVIVGASAAGIAAGLYAARRNLNFVIVSEDVGGEVANSGDIDNYPGIPHTDGLSLTEEFKKQITRYDMQVIQPARVERIEHDGSLFTLHIKRGSAEEQITSKTTIVATGVHPRHLDVPGEEEFKGKGVTYCTTCDGPLYKGKTVATVGGGNSALESAIMLSGIAEKVYLLTIHPEMKGEQVLIDKVKNLSNVEILGNAQTSAITGEQTVSGLAYTDKESGEAKTIDVQGVFIHIGFLPNSALVKDVADLNDFGEIETDPHMQTKIPGLYAAGDVTTIPWKQIAIATGQGVTAALNAVQYLNNRAD